jgi:hypothetical protein
MLSGVDKMKLNTELQETGKNNFKQTTVSMLFAFHYIYP